MGSDGPGCGRLTEYVARAYVPGYADQGTGRDLTGAAKVADRTIIGSHEPITLQPSASFRTRCRGFDGGNSDRLWPGCR